MDILKQQSKYKVDRIAIAGSIGKRTSLCGSDVDCVLFINDEHPPFDHVLSDFKIVLDESNIGKHFKIRKANISLQVKNDDFKLDLVPATNFIKNTKKTRRLIQLQQKLVLQYIEQNPTEYGYIYSSSLAEASVKFMKNRSGFAHEMARIAKYWFKTLDFDYVPGASTFIELVAVHAARRGRKGSRKNNSHLKSFARFLKLLEDFDVLIVVLKERNQFTDNQSILEIPRLVDPVNPFNNYARHWDAEAKKRMQYYAKTTFDLLERLVSSSKTDEQRIIDLLFESQSFIE